MLTRGHLTDLLVLLFFLRPPREHPKLKDSSVLLQRNWIWLVWWERWCPVGLSEHQRSRSDAFLGRRFHRGCQQDGKPQPYTNNQLKTSWVIVFRLIKTLFIFFFVVYDQSIKCLLVLTLLHCLVQLKLCVYCRNPDTRPKNQGRE